MDAVMATVMNRAAQTFFHTGGVTLLGAGVFESAVLERAMALCPDLYCADGGANIAPVAPLAVIGDLDSVDRAAAHLRGCVFHLCSIKTAPILINLWRLLWRIISCVLGFWAGG